MNLLVFFGYAPLYLRMKHLINSKNLNVWRKIRGREELSVSMLMMEESMLANISNYLSFLMVFIHNGSFPTFHTRLEPLNEIIGLLWRWFDLCFIPRQRRLHYGGKHLLCNPY
jgi:hypothetical protein